MTGPLRQIWSIWLAALFAAMMLVAPAGLEAAAEASAEAACHASLDPHNEGAPGAHAADPHQEQEGRGVTHHAHGCGGCHIHALTPAALFPPFPEKAFSRPEWTPDASPARDAPALFRPPRV